MMLIDRAASVTLTDSLRPFKKVFRAEGARLQGIASLEETRLIQRIDVEHILPDPHSDPGFCVARSPEHPERQVLDREMG